MPSTPTSCRAESTSVWLSLTKNSSPSTAGPITLNPRNLLIADTERGVAIGGVMGGEDTGVTETTRHVLLESAYFLPASVRRTARELNLPSDASYRFERGVDPGMVLRASERAAQLIREIAGGQPRYRDDHGRNIAGAAARIRSPLRALQRVARRLRRASGGGSDSRRFRSGKTGRRRTSNQPGAFPVIAPIFAAKWT